MFWWDKKNQPKKQPTQDKFKILLLIQIWDMAHNIIEENITENITSQKPYKAGALMG